MSAKLSFLFSQSFIIIRWEQCLGVRFNSTTGKVTSPSNDFRGKFNEEFAGVAQRVYLARRSRTGSSPTSVCRDVRKFMDQKYSAAILATKRAAGVTPEENYWDHTSPEACKRRAHSGLKPQCGHHQKLKLGPIKTPMSSRKVAIAPTDGKQQRNLSQSVNGNRPYSAGHTLRLRFIYCHLAVWDWVSLS